MAALLSILGGLAAAALLRGLLTGSIPARARGPLGITLLALAMLALLARQAGAALALGAAGAALVISGRGARGRGGGTSTVRTDALEMTLDHESGEMRGRVLIGDFAGRELSELDREARLRLAAELEDERSLTLLRSWMDRHDPAWREDGGGERATAGDGGPMTREAAYRLLGLAPGADAEAIRAAHRRLMKKVHPDAGGSEPLAAQVNEAKDLLLGG